jgi:hypothetical protein
VLKVSIKIDPSRTTNKPSYTVLVATLVDLGHVDRALAEAEPLLRLHPNDAHVLNACGRMFLELSRKKGNPAFARRGHACFAAAGSIQSAR